jgi:UDP-N-acetylglucosamine diphosphorylase/glucosamine-1-phosphate N-acetyltransferase
MDISFVHKITDMHVGGFLNAENPKELHELITLHNKNFSENLKKYKEENLKDNPEYSEVEPNVFVHKSADIHSSTVFNTPDGLIIIEKNVQIKPFSYLTGPLRIDENAKINTHSNIEGSYIGKFSKIGGEVSDSVIESYTNKEHHGYVGDSYIGSWVNLGAGTSTSNLKNTYGNIKMNGVETGEQFLGSVISDHVKTAINTSIYTGKVIGVGAHIYGTVTSDVPNFVNYYSKDNITEIPIEVTEKIATRMMLRRGLEFTDEDKKILELMYKNNE